MTKGRRKIARVRPNRTSSANFRQPSSHAAVCLRKKTRWHRKCWVLHYPCSSAIHFCVTCQRQNHPRMTSTVLRWTAKHHPFTHLQYPTHQNNPTNGSKVRRGPLFFVCLITFPTKKMLKTALQSAFGRCKHLLRANKRLKTRLS